MPWPGPAATAVNPLCDCLSFVFLTFPSLFFSIVLGTSPAFGLVPMSFGLTRFELATCDGVARRTASGGLNVLRT